MEDSIKQNGRVIVVEPNDVSGGVGQVPMTPDYTDYCISVRLMCEVVSRIKQNDASTTVDSVKYQIVNQINPNKKTNWVSFMAGKYIKLYDQALNNAKNGEKSGFLSTYYTDISADDVLRETEVEGLGIESIQVAFESYYMPTITIKFVDHRGSAIFGREEAIHDNDNITVDSIFGAFFTQPYPKFKLQVKGFYGKAVTYQLTCSSFKANFNTQTGNFEAIVKFIGYSYSLLTDIPFHYLVAAPYCEYVGAQYWNSHKNDESWRLYDDGGHGMMKLGDFFQRLSVTLNKKEQLSALNEQEEKALSSYNDEKNAIADVQSKIEQFITVLKKSTGDHTSFVTNYDGRKPLENEQLLLFSNIERNPNDIQAQIVVRQVYGYLVDAIKNYNKQYTELIADSTMPNGKSESFPDMTFIDTFVIDEEKNITLRGDYNIDDLTTMPLNENFTMQKDLANIVKKKIAQKDEIIKQYCYLVNFYNIRKKLSERSSRIEEERKNLVNKAESDYIRLAKSELHIVPYIGNIFKMIMAHVETLVYMMFHCFNNIKLAERIGVRTNKALGINDISSTDVVFNSGANNEAIFPWPMVTRQEEDTASGDTKNTIAWVGDFSHNFEEEKLVRSLYNAMKRVFVPKNSGETKEKVSIFYLPVLPNDLNEYENVFNGEGSNNISSLAGMLGMRMAQIFGITLNEKYLEPGVCKKFGIIDAYNFFLLELSRPTIKTNILDRLGDKTLVEKIINIITCNKEGDNDGLTSENNEKSFHAFETAGKVLELGRHPIFHENGNNLEYVHYFKNNKGTLCSIVPAMIQQDFRTYNNYIEPHVENGKATDFNIKPGDYETIIFNTNATELSEQTNKEMFNIISSQGAVEAITKRYDDMKSGSFQLSDSKYEEEGLGEAIDIIYKISDDVYGKHFKNDVTFLTERVYNTNGDKQVSNTAQILEKYGTDEYKNLYGTDGKVSKTIKYSKDGIWQSDKTRDALCIAEINVVRNGSNGSSGTEALVVSKLYGLQSKITVDTQRECAKALLFLHSMVSNGYNLDKFTPQEQTNGTISVMPIGKALLIGGLLWRSAQAEDPFQFDEIQSNTQTDTFFSNDNQFKYAYANDGDKVTYKKISEVINDKGITYITAPFIELFKNFVQNDWPTIRDNIELRDKSGNLVFVEDEKKSSEILSDITIDPNNITESARLKTIQDKYANFETYFYNIYSNKRFIRLHLNDRNNICQNKLKDIFLNKVFILNTLGKPSSTLNSQKTTITISTANARAYLEGFESTLQKICRDEYYKATTPSPEENEETDKEFTRDLAIPIYYYLKSLWDKWLVSSVNIGSSMDKDAAVANNEYSVKYFFGRFIFIDSFYRNIANKFMINCQVLLEQYENIDANKDVSLFSFIGNILHEHHCMFLALPDFTEGLSDKSEQKVKDSMSSIFTPYPYEALTEMESENKFVTIYTPKFSENSAELNNFRYDGFDILNTTKETKEGTTDNSINNNTLPPQLVNDPTDADAASYIPAFTLAYGRQNQHIFTNLNLNMETPIVTSATIATLTNILTKASNAQHQINFVGQDIYPVFSNYSYICEFDMMGCAQIQPLMYFQLMNIPMWKGTYMIFNVSHNIQAGNMITHVKAYKLSNKSYPYTKQWFTKIANNIDSNLNGDCGQNGTQNATFSVPPASGKLPFVGKSDEEKLAMCRVEVGWTPDQAMNAGVIKNVTFNQTGGKKTLPMNKYIAEDFQAICDEILQLGFFKLNVGNCYRKYLSAGGKSLHQIGVAVDINGGRGGNPWFKRHIAKNEPEPKVGDLPWPIQESPYYGGYDRSKCTWHWGHPVVQIFLNHGWGWGGQYGDVMHFSITGH